MEITTISIWYHLPFGFRPWIGGVTPPVVFDMSRPGPHVATVALNAFAIAAPRDGCVPTFTVSGVDVEFVVEPGNNHTLDFQATYSSGTATTAVVCGGRVEASRSDTFSINGLVGVAAEPTLGTPTVARVAPHRAQADATINGLTYVIVTALP